VADESTSVGSAQSPSPDEEFGPPPFTADKISSDVQRKAYNSWLIAKVFVVILNVVSPWVMLCLSLLLRGSS